MEPAVRGSIPIPQKMMYAESKKIGIIQDLERHFPEFCVMIDSSEQQIPRPKKKMFHCSMYLYLWHPTKMKVISRREIDSDSFDLSTCTINDVHTIYEMTHHIDNPAKAKSTTFNDEQQQTPPHQFLHVRRAYSIEKSKTIYRYETLIISFDESQICPICSRKLRLIEPIDRGETNVVDLPLDEIVSVDCEIYRYVENFSDPRGQMYFDEDGVMCYDDGVPIPGPYHELLPDSVKLIHDKMIHRCKVKASIRLETGKTPTNKEIDEAILTQQSIFEPLEWHKTFPASEKITKWFDGSLHLSDGKRG